MKKTLCFILALVLALSLCACGGSTTPSQGAASSNGDVASTGSDAANGETEWLRLELSVAAPFPEENAALNSIRMLQEKIDERMDGAIQFTIYGSGTLLAGTEVYDGVINGSAAVGYWQTNYSTGRFPLCNLAEYPGVTYSGTKAASYVFRDYINTLKPAELDDVHVLMVNATGCGTISSSIELTSMEQLAGKQVRATSISSNILEVNGITPTSMEFSECYEGLRTGLLDGVFTHFEAACNANFYEVAPYIMVTPLYNQCNIIIMSKSIYDSMPAAQQQLLDELCEEVFEEFNCEYIGNPAYLEKVAQSVPEFAAITYLEGEALEAATAACEPITAEYVESLNAQGLDGTGALELLNELADKYNEMFPASDLKELYEQYR